MTESPSNLEEPQVNIAEENPDAASTSRVNLKNEIVSIDSEFIKKYESLPSLWDATHPDYNNKVLRNQAYKQLLQICKKLDPNLTVYHVRTKINTLRTAYRKDLKKYIKSRRIDPDGTECYTHMPTNWKFYALRFLGGDAEVLNTMKAKVEEINVDEAGFENDSESDISIEEEFLIEHKPQKHHSTLIYNTSGKKAKKESESNDSFNLTDISNVELKAVGANVVCKLSRMSDEQRSQAELLINKVLYHGLKNNLTSNTDLAEVEQERSLIM